MSSRYIYVSRRLVAGFHSTAVAPSTAGRGPIADIGAPDANSSSTNVSIGLERTGGQGAWITTTATEQAQSKEHRGKTTFTRTCRQQKLSGRQLNVQRLFIRWIRTTTQPSWGCDVSNVGNTRSKAVGFSTRNGGRANERILRSTESIPGRKLRPHYMLPCKLRNALRINASRCL